ncbi:MAG: outer membrane lipoprotein carrier protein LolA [Candidatus Competibacter sp.]|nr:outer membrane lipoprotein carrier protein LolA [Candidatus Competibacter sp.]MDG4583114.1 outer membrane lipoprotein carrier protein LolA [Candidatus Competibacter sp.]
MKRWSWLLLLLGGWPLGLSAADGTLDQVMRVLAAVPTVQAAFREEKTLAILQEPLVSSGMLTYRAPAYLRKQTLQPRPEEYEADDHWLTVETPTDGRRQFDLNGYPQLRPFVEAIRATQAGDRTTLERYYRLDFQGALADWSLRLTPRDPEFARYLTAIVIRGRAAWIDSVETLEADGDQSLMTVSPR